MLVARTIDKAESLVGSNLPAATLRDA